MRQPPATTDDGTVGPNAVTQLRDVLLEHGDRGLARQVFLAAGRPDWLETPPTTMVLQTEAARVHAALHRLLPPERAHAIATEAGMRTGLYILANRIPKSARMVLKLLPAPISARLLVEGVAAHAWTFAGSGRFGWQAGQPMVLTIAANPLAVVAGCPWHVAVLQWLFRSLVSPAAEVQETACCAAGAPACRFEVTWGPPAPAAVEPLRP